MVNCRKNFGKEWRGFGKGSANTGSGKDGSFESSMLRYSESYSADLLLKFFCCLCETRMRQFRRGEMPNVSRHRHNRRRVTMGLYCGESCIFIHLASIGHGSNIIRNGPGIWVLRGAKSETWSSLVLREGWWIVHHGGTMEHLTILRLGTILWRIREDRRWTTATATTMRNRSGIWRRTRIIYLN